MIENARALPAAGVASPYLAPAVRSVDEAVARMEEITAFIEATNVDFSNDGVACFNYLYTVITRRVRDGIVDGLFEDRAFITQLDIVFANMYFDALRADAEHLSTVPRSWAVLFDRRDDRRIEPIQFAMAGVNAHINYDLAISVVDTCSALRTQPRSGSQRADYQKLNQIFADEMQDLRRHYQGTLQRMLDTAAAPVLNLIGNWSVVVTRNAAWTGAERLWEIRRRGESEEPFRHRLDRLATISGELLLTPVI